MWGLEARLPPGYIKVSVWTLVRGVGGGCLFLPTSSLFLLLERARLQRGAATQSGARLSRGDLLCSRADAQKQAPSDPRPVREPHPGRRRWPLLGRQKPTGSEIELCFPLIFLPLSHCTKSSKTYFGAQTPNLGVYLEVSLSCLTPILSFICSLLP